MDAAQRSWYMQRLGIPEWQERGSVLALATPTATAEAEPVAEPAAARSLVTKPPARIDLPENPVLPARPVPQAALEQRAEAHSRTPIPTPSMRVVRLRGNAQAGIAVLLPPGKNADPVLLDALLASIGLNLDKALVVAVARSGEPAEALLMPVVLVLGQLAASAALGRVLSLAQARGRVHVSGQQRFVVSYHPDELRKNPSLKRLAWQDLKLLATAIVQTSGPTDEN